MIFLLLCSELWEKDILKCTTIRAQINEVLDESLKELAQAMKVCSKKIHKKID